MSHIECNGMPDCLIREPKQNINSVNRNNFLVMRKGNWNSCQAGSLTLSATGQNGSSGEVCLRNNSPHAMEVYSYQTGTTMQYWNFLIKWLYGDNNTVYSSTFQPPLVLSGYLSNSKSGATEAVYALASEIQFTIDAKATSLKEVRLK